MSGIVGLLAEIASVPHMPRALCRNRAPLFDSASQATEAVALCRRCPELDPCRSWANALPRDAITGVVAAEVRSGPPPEPSRCGRPNTKGLPCRNLVEVAGQPCPFHISAG